MAIVYTHTRLDTDEIFYVGIGKEVSRANSKKSRTKHWHNIANSVGYRVNIVVQDVTWEVAASIEKELIAEYGRKDKGVGQLVNMTDGGDGTVGRLYLEETRQKQHDAMVGRTMSTEAIEKRSAARLGKSRKQETKAKLRLANLGKKHSEKTKEKMSKAKQGRKHSEEAKSKMRKPRPKSAEHRLKLSEAAKKRWNRLD